MILEKINKITKEESAPMSTINSVKPSLEDAFIKITGLSPTVMKVEKLGGK